MTTARSTTTRFGRGLLAAAAALALLAACSDASAEDTGDTAEAGTGEPVEGGTLIFADIEMQTDFQTQRGFNYTQTNVFRNLLDRLTYVDPASGEIVPWLASEFSVNEDNTEFTFVIRPDVTFSDGTPLDAEIVKANLDLLGLGDEEKGIVKNRDFIGYEGTEIVGDDTVVVTLSEPNSYFLRATAASTASIVGAATLELDGAGQSGIENIVGTGPFVFSSQVPEQEIVLEKREDYAWPPSTAANQGAPYLDEVIFRGIPEVGLRAGAVTSEQVHIARGIQPNDEAQVEASDAVLAVAETPDLTANWAALRANSDIVGDENVRRALLIGFDREALKETVLSDSYPVSGSVLNRAAPGFVDLSDEFAYDFEEAQRLLDEAGWVEGADGIREKDGQRLELAIAASPRSVVIRPAFEFIETEWRKLGVDFTNNAGDDAIFTSALADPDYPMVGSRQFYLGGLGPLFSAEGNTNTYFADAELDELFARERAAVTAEEAAAALEDVQRRLVVELAIVIPLWDEVQVHAVQPNVHVEFDGGSAPILQGAWIAE